MHKLQSIQMYLKQASWGISQFFLPPYNNIAYMSQMLRGAATSLDVNYTIVSLTGVRFFHYYSRT